MDRDLVQRRRWACVGQAEQGGCLKGDVWGEYRKMGERSDERIRKSDERVRRKGDGHS